MVRGILVAGCPVIPTNPARHLARLDYPQRPYAPFPLPLIFAAAVFIAASTSAIASTDATSARAAPAITRYVWDRCLPAAATSPVLLENSQRVWVALGGHETCPRPVPGGLAWRGTVAAARVACASVLPGGRPRRGVLRLRVYRAVGWCLVPVHRGLACTAVNHGALCWRAARVAGTIRGAFVPGK